MALLERDLTPSASAARPDHFSPASRTRRSTARAAGLPARYAAVAAASLLLLLAATFSVPLGPGAGTPPRGLLTTALTVAGLALLLLAALRAPVPAPQWAARAYRRLRPLALVATLVLVLATAATFAGGVYYTILAPPSAAYQSDVIAFTHVDAQLALAGRNPYTADDAFWPALARYPWAELTPLRAGAFAGEQDHPLPGRLFAVARRDIAPPHGQGEFDPRTLHSYPALSFLLYAPLLLAGAPNILPLNLLAFWLLFAWLLWLAPVGWRHWAALAAGACLITVGSSLYLDTEVICLLFILGAWHWRDRRWASAVLLGLGCAFKQYCWFFAPLLLLEAAREAGWRAAAKRALVALGAFLLPNLPYLVADPAAWWTSLWLPMTDPLFPMGMGLIALSTGHLLPYGPQSLYAALEGLAFVAALAVAVRWRERLGDAVLLLPLLPLFFAFRSGTSYFAFLPWLALYAVHRLYAADRAALPAVERMRGSAYALALAAVRRLGLALPEPPRASAPVWGRRERPHPRTLTPIMRRRRAAGIPPRRTAPARDEEAGEPRRRSCA